MKNFFFVGPAPLAPPYPYPNPNFNPNPNHNSILVAPHKHSFVSPSKSTAL